MIRISSKLKNLTKNIKNQLNPEQNLRKDLEKSFQDLKIKQEDLQNRNLGEKNRIQQLKTEILGQLFATMQDLGVDPNNLESISQFLQKLEQQDPDLVVLFEIALSNLSPEAEVEVEPEVSPAPTLMDKYKNLQETILRQ